MNRLEAIRVDDYKPKLVHFRCARCQRFAEHTIYALRASFGPDMTLGAVALQMAATSPRPCPLATGEHPLCRAYPETAPVEHWATLEDARYGGWTCLFYCERRHASLKAASSCPGPMKLHVPTLIVALGARFRLDRLYRNAQCPKCGSEIFAIRWEAPTEPEPAKVVSKFDEEHTARVAAEIKRRTS